MGIFSAHPCWIILCCFRIMEPACWDHSQVLIFSPRMLTDNRWTWEKGQWTDDCWNAHFYVCISAVITLECSSRLSPTSLEPPALLAEISTCCLSLAFPGTGPTGTAVSPWPQHGPAYPCLSPAGSPAPSPASGALQCLLPGTIQESKTL